MKKIVIIIILEGKQPYTEINFFESFLKIFKNKFKKIVFIPLLSINGNLKNQAKFIKLVKEKIDQSIKMKTNQKIDDNQKNIFFVSEIMIKTKIIYKQILLS